MANPNMLNTTSVLGKSTVSTVNTTATTFLTNSSTSNSIYKVNMLSFTNAGNAAASVTVAFAEGANPEIKTANTLSVPLNSTLVVYSKDTSIYMEEGEKMNVYASANATITVFCSYEIIS
jgi:hypothetical protein